VADMVRGCDYIGLHVLLSPLLCLENVVQAMCLLWQSEGVWNLI